MDLFGNSFSVHVLKALNTFLFLNVKRKPVPYLLKCFRLCCIKINDDIEDQNSFRRFSSLNDWDELQVMEKILLH